MAVRAQLLDADRPPDLITMVEHLTLLQLDPTAAVAPSADLVAWSRLGSGYHPDDLKSALEDDRTLFELDAFVRPMADLALFAAEMAQPPRYESTRAWLEANDSFRRDILERLATSGPLLSRDIPDSASVPWGSTGWTNNRNVTKMLEVLALRGQVAIAGREGRQRLWDLPGRVYPQDVPEIPLTEARRIRSERRLRALGMAREKTTVVPGEPYSVGAAGILVQVEGIAGEWRIDPDAFEEVDEPFTGRVALLSPFDRLVHDRSRTQELFDYEYVLEMYKPKDQRRWGYFALPILFQDRLVGKLDARANRKAGVLEVFALHEDEPFTRAMTAAVWAIIDDLASWLELDVAGR